MAGVLYRLGRLCASRAVVVVAVWLGLVLVVQLAVWGVGAETTTRRCPRRRTSTRRRTRLFLVTRHRDQMAAGVDRQESIARSVATSGGAIVFAGGTVIIALLSLWVAGIPLVASLGYASAVAVLTAVLAAITLLPAVLSLAGGHLFGARLPAFSAPGRRRGR